MIKAISKKGGVEVHIETSDITEVMFELTCVIQSMRENFSREYPVEVVDVLIAAAGRMAYAENEDELKQIQQELNLSLEEDLKQRGLA